ncbi:hypothetical protein N9864_00545 [bacterium]|nr:hypothetical protein [bacterium]|tara:strand:- start:214 stop:936 length:723 start_codon:yes stop_codon:yes gene_type:complete
MKIIYRISDAGYNKVKPDYINNETCLANATKIFKDADWSIIADNVSKETSDMIEKYKSKDHIYYASVGNGAATFNLALNEALTYGDDEIVYFIENDYIHLPNSPKIIEEGIKLGAPYVTLYLHPDKFIPPQQGGNPEVDETGGYLTRIYRGETELFGMFNSTTMTFASTVKNLKEDEEILRKWTSETHPNDFQMFLELRDKGKALMCPLNTYSTHGETQWLAPLYKTKQQDLVEEWAKHI